MHYLTSLSSLHLPCCCAEVIVAHAWMASTWTRLQYSPRNHLMAEILLTYVTMCKADISHENFLGNKQSPISPRPEASVGSFLLLESCWRKRDGKGFPKSHHCQGWFYWCCLHNKGIWQETWGFQKWNWRFFISGGGELHWIASGINYGTGFQPALLDIAL